MTEIKFVNTHYLIEPTLEWLSHLPLLGIDVERDDSHHYDLIPALIQIGGDDQVAIFDPISLRDPEDWKPIAQFVKSRTTIFHAMENDLPPLAQVGIVPQVVHDTSLAAAFLNLPRGLGDLAKEVLNITLAPDKNEMQRAPWERRPLTPSEIEYAAGDVAFLPELFHKMSEFLHTSERYEWYREEIEYQHEKGPPMTRRSWHSVKGAHRLDAYGRARFAFLWEAREAIAYNTDTIPAIIFPDKLLVSLVVTMPQNLTHLRKLGLPPKSIRLYGDQILRAVRSSESIVPIPKTNFARLSNKAEREAIQALREARTAIAEKHNLNPGFMLAIRNISKAVTAKPASHEEFRFLLDVRNWQWNLLSKDFCEILEEFFAFDPPDS